MFTPTRIGVCQSRIEVPARNCRTGSRWRGAQTRNGSTRFHPYINYDHHIYMTHIMYSVKESIFEWEDHIDESDAGASGGEPRQNR